MQTNEFRKATSFRALAVGRSRSDNTFATARNLGTIRANTTRFSARASGSVGRSDKVDFYKFTVAPGANLPRGRNTYRLRNSSATFSRYAVTQGRRTLLNSRLFQPGTTSFLSSVRNPGRVPTTFYLKVEKPTGNARYNFVFDFFR